MNESGLGSLPPTTVDFLPQFKAINNSLKKRFFRKPNVADAIEQYETLGQELQREEQTTFAALCFLEASKCHESLKTPVPQANSLVRAGKLYLASSDFEKHFVSHVSSGAEKLPGPQKHLSGNLEMGVQTLSQAAKVFHAQGYKATAHSLNLKDGSYGEALNYYKAALIDAKQNFAFLDQLHVIELVCKAKVKMMEYESVLKTVNDTLVSIKNYQSEIPEPLEKLTTYFQRFHVMKVLLVLILGANTADLLEYIWPAESYPGGSDAVIEEDIATESKSLTDAMNHSSSVGESNKTANKAEELEYLLKSLVLTVQNGVSEDLELVQNKLFPFLSETHHDLLKYLIQLQL